MASRTESPGVAVEPDPDRYALRLPDGRRYDFARGTLADAAGVQQTAFKLTEEPFGRVAAWDPARGQFVLGGNDPGVPVTVFAPFDPARGARAPAPAVTAPLTWARPGTVLTYELADFDAQDTWRFEVLEADAALALKIVMDEDELVAASARFSASALDDATAFVRLQQGGSNVDLAVEQHEVVPPIVLSRARAAKLAKGKSLPFESEWTEKTTLDSKGATVAHVRVDGAERAVAAHAAADDGGVSLTVLADPRWPLVIERVEGDCFVRLVEVDTGRATPAPVAAAAPASLASETRRFELVEGASAKFWEVSVSGAAVTVRFGKLGAAGQTQTKDHGSPETASKEAEKLVREKVKKGYQPV